MPNRRHLSVRDMERILGMLQAGATQRYAAAQFGVTQSVVQRVWQRLLDTGSVEERPKSGRPRKWMASSMSLCLDVRGLTRQELQTNSSFMQLVSLFVNRQSEIVFMTTEFMLGDQP